MCINYNLLIVNVEILLCFGSGCLALFATLCLRCWQNLAKTFDTHIQGESSEADTANKTEDDFEKCFSAMSMQKRRTHDITEKHFSINQKTSKGI